MFKLTQIAIALFGTTAINFAVSYISWRRRKTKGGMYFSLGMFGITLWTLAEGLDYAAVPLSLKVFFASVEIATQIAERWRSTIQESSILENDMEISVTISCGISEFPANAATETEALEKADKALYAAKYNGRNQVVLWSNINT